MTAVCVHLMRATALSAALALVAGVPAQAQTARTRYTETQSRDEQIRGTFELTATLDAAATARVLADARAVISAYESLVRRYPNSGYADNALFNAARLADTLHQQFGRAEDRDQALTLYRRVGAEYPASSLITEANRGARRLGDLATAEPAQVVPVAVTRQAAAAGLATKSPRGRATLTSIERTVVADTIRVTLALDREVPFHEETLAGPARVFFDLKGVEAVPDLVDAVLRFPSDVVRQIRVGRHPNSTVRVVVDLEGVGRHSIYTLYNPFRVVIDCERSAARVAHAAPVATPLGAPPRVVIPDAPPVVMTTLSPPSTTPDVVAPVSARPTTPVSAATPAPEAPNANAAGGFSLARQLGLGVSRIVIDPGHGGHDPGAQARGLSESELTLDVALRLETLLEKEPGIDVVLTRRTDEYVPLEERTAIANRESADLFLSIHANTSRNPSARGVETYVLSFATTPEAEAVAARENSAHAGEMHHLPDIIKAIALNNKLDESRDLAAMVQDALVTRLRRSNSAVLNRGVKKAPFVVLIGAGMPSVLAEVSFLTNRQELQLLKTPAYQQRIAEALAAAVLRYRRSLKGPGAIASQ